MHVKTLYTFQIYSINSFLTASRVYAIVGRVLVFLEDTFSTQKIILTVLG